MACFRRLNRRRVFKGPVPRRWKSSRWLNSRLKFPVDQTLIPRRRNLLKRWGGRTPVVPLPVTRRPLLRSGRVCWESPVSILIGAALLAGHVLFLKNVVLLPELLRLRGRGRWGQTRRVSIMVWRRRRLIFCLDRRVPKRLLKLTRVVKPLIPRRSKLF